MAFLNTSRNKFLEFLGNRKVVCIGASKILKKYYNEEKAWFTNWQDKISFFVDNDEKKWNRKYTLGDKEYNVYPFSKLKDLQDTVIMITVGNRYILEICNQLAYEKLDHFDVFALSILLVRKDIDDTVVENILTAPTELINKKIIHTFWFSGDKIPPEYQRCISSWERFCPDYKIKIWNTEDYDVRKNRYMREAYEAKKWAFVSDYARLDIIYRYGGIYLDMDVEVLKKLDDLLKLECFFGIDSWKYVDLGTGFGALPRNELIGDLLAVYDNMSFCSADGKINEIPQPKLLRDIFIQYGLKDTLSSQRINNTYFLSLNYLNVYEGKVLNEYHLSGKEYLIHRHNAGWWDEKKRNDRYNNQYKNREMAEKKFIFFD